MNFPKFLPVVIEIVIDGDGNRFFICRNSNGVVQRILHEASEISSFVDELCNLLVSSVPDNIQLNSTK